MFKPISSSLKRKEQSYRRNQDALRTVTQAVGVFFMSALNMSLEESGAQCEWLEDNLTIQTNNKALASELTMRLGELTRFLQTRDLNLARIIIR